MIATQQDHSLASRIIERFESSFGTSPLVVRSPGRVNLLGEHTDYNNGFVLPAAINKAIYMGVSRRDDHLIHIISQDLDLSYMGDTRAVKPSSLHWPDYILGVLQQLQAQGHVIGGFNCVFGGDIPLGAGMSSSAALECATAFALNELFGLGLDPLTMVTYYVKPRHACGGSATPGVAAGTYSVPARDVPVRTVSAAPFPQLRS